MIKQLPLALLHGIALFVPMKIKADPVPVRSFGALPDGRPVHLYTLDNAKGLKAVISDYGGTIVSLESADRTGQSADIVLGFNSLADYEMKSPYFGALIGRVGNRIARGMFSLDGKSYALALNNHPGGIPCHLHGGKRGFDKVLWSAEPTTRNGLPALRLSYRSKDGEEGYPGNLDVVVVYSLLGDNSLSIEYSATTDQPTPINLTNHSYFNLGGEGHGTILNHQITIHAAQYTPVDAGLIPTGKLSPVANTPLDFTQSHTIGERIDAEDQQLKYGGGYDHNFVLDPSAEHLRLAAAVFEPTKGRVMEVLTTEPGVQFYSGNFLDGTTKGKSGQPYLYRGALALETQHFPDSVNHPEFPTTILRPGDVFHSTTIYRFSAK